MNSTARIQINLQKARRSKNTEQETTRRQTGGVHGAEGDSRASTWADKGNLGDLQSEDNQGCQHCSLDQPNGVMATTERKASRREEGVGGSEHC